MILFSPFFGVFERERFKSYKILADVVSVHCAVVFAETATGGLLHTSADGEYAHLSAVRMRRFPFCNARAGNV